MICKTCSHETDGIKLNGKLYCSHCGNILDAQDIDGAAVSAQPLPEAKIILDNLSNESLPDTQEELEKLKETEEVLEGLMGEYFRPKSLEIKKAQEENIPGMELSKDPEVTEDSELTKKLSGLEEELKSLEKEIVKANRPRFVKNLGKVGAPIKEELPAPEPVMSQPTPPALHPNTEESGPPLHQVMKEDSQEPQSAPSEEEIPQPDNFQASPQARSQEEGLTEPEIVAPKTKEAPEPKESHYSYTPLVQKEEPMTTEAQPEKTSVNLMQGEKGYCVKCRKMREMLQAEEVLLKNGHSAEKGKCAYCGTTIFKLIKGGSTNKKVYKKKGGNTFFGLFHLKKRAKHKKPDEKEAPKEERNIKETTEEPKKKHKKRGVLRKIIIFFSVIFIILGVTLGFIFYVTRYASNGILAVNKAESTVSFSYNKPDYIPPGYDPSYLTNAGPEYIEYIYTYRPDTNKKVTIRIMKGERSEEEMLEELVRPLGGSYSNINIKESMIWIMESGRVIFSSRGATYDIEHESDLPRSEVLKIVDSLI